MQRIVIPEEPKMDARLVMEAGTAYPSQLDFDSSSIVKIGRSKENNLVLRDEMASRFHAEVYFQEGSWFLKNLSQSNGTRVEDVFVQGTIQLDLPVIIQIGDSQLRMELADDSQATTKRKSKKVSSEPLADVTIDSHLSGEFAALYGYMIDCLLGSTPRLLVEKALQLLLKQCGAEQVGYSGLEGEGVPKIILPENGNPDAELSASLTREAKNRKNVVWLLGDDQDMVSESLGSMKDAICIPLFVQETEKDSPVWMGAVHLYHSSRGFRPGNIDFARSVCNCLGNSLNALKRRLVLKSDLERVKIHSGNTHEEMVGQSPQLKKVLDSVSRLAPRNNTVLITGESGVGKELVALGLHRLSSRNKGPLVCVNCATLNNTLADAELFGHAQGAYTGADQSGMGYFQQADDGTLFLDEVGELTPDVQAKLLRVLETGKFRPVRGKEISVDVRVVAATNRDLEKEVEEGRFRKDLYYRLANIQIEVPPLRERMADIPRLVEHFLKMFAIQYHKPVSITREAMDKLGRYHWPGNIRQLKSVLESSLNRSAGSMIEETDIEVPRERREGPDLPGVMSLEELEAWGIERALESTDWNQTQAAAVLGIHRETLMTKMRKYGLRKK